MPPKKTDDKISHMLEEALVPIKETLKELTTNDKMAHMLSDLEEKLLGKIREQEEEIKSIKNRCSQLEGRLPILENLGKIQSIETPMDIEYVLHSEFEKM